MKLRSLACAWLLPLAALAAQPALAAPLLDIADPAGDDDGDGSLVYPRDSAFTPGDLDLRSLRVWADGADLRFEATFANPVRDPAGVRADSPGSEDLAQFARRGFYAFNLDLYIDTDRITGSGNTGTLPGRRARLDPGSAWEKAVVLTPRPELVRRQLRDALADTSGGDTATAAALDASVFFPTQVRVRGRSISFSVPRAFLGGAAIENSAITALVTAAQLTIGSDLMAGLQGGNAFERLSLGAMQPAVGRPAETLGHANARAPATAVVDLLQPDGAAQRRQLADGGLLQGLARTPVRAGAVAAEPPWFTRAMAAAQAGGAPAARTVSTSTAPAPAAAPPVPPAPLAPPVVVVTPAPAAAVPPRPPAPAATVVVPVPAAPAAAPPAAPAAPRGAAFYEEQEQRLRALKRLRDNGLISEDEYQAKRREILGAL
ncbi:glucodextranase DOMON-like domain-containing protein [Rubrivivax sp. RP6-9]|uniref:glucodextranase DOMON-like domain-containing protein n=1 Tax=Rubrivivax sp. RP6-9 TaxID=3415750 RepID=UPI003CC60829